MLLENEEISYSEKDVKLEEEEIEEETSMETHLWRITAMMHFYKFASLKFHQILPCRGYKIQIFCTRQ